MKNTPLTRKTPMPPPSKPLTSRTELRRVRLETAPLDTGVGPQRTSTLKPGEGLTRTTRISSKPSAKQRDRALVWAEVKVEAWDAWGGKCALHGLPIAIEHVHGHHRLMKSQGGLDIVENCLPICDAAHRQIHANRPGFDSYGRGLLVHAGFDPCDEMVEVEWL